MKVKCKACGKSIEKEESYIDSSGSKSAYYCNELEYKHIVSENEYKKLTMAMMLNISGLKSLGTPSTIMINKLNKKIVDKYGSNEVLYNTIICSMKAINEGIENNSILNGNDKIKYTLAILDRNIDEGVKMMKRNRKINNVNFEELKYSMDDAVYIKRENKNDISGILELMGEV